MLSKYQSLVDLLNPKKEELMTPIIQPEPETNMSLPPAEPEPSEAMSKMSQEQMDELNNANEQQNQQPEIPDNTPMDQVLRIPQLSDILPPKQETVNQEQPQTPMLAQATPTQVTETPLSRLEALMQQYRGEDQKSLEEARRQDRMLKVGGALGDALATYLNARSQMNVKAPGVQVQQGAGLGKIADMFATSGNVASDVKARRESLLKQYEELAKGERAKARLTSEEKREQNRLAAQEKARQETADLQRELTKARIEGGLKEAGIRASGKEEKEKEFTPYQEKQIKREDEKDLQKLSTTITKLGLPTITSAINSIENQLGMTLEEALQRNTDKDETNDVSVPGYGRLGSLAPDVLVGDKSRAFRQDVGSLLNPQISKQFGASQTKGEIERFQKEVGSGTFESESAILRGLSNIKRSANADLKATYAGYRPELVDIYRTREGVSLQGIPEQKENKGRVVFPKTVINKKTKETAIVQDEQELKEALAEGFE